MPRKTSVEHMVGKSVGKIKPVNAKMEVIVDGVKWCCFVMNGRWSVQEGRGAMMQERTLGVTLVIRLGGVPVGLRNVSGRLSVLVLAPGRSASGRGPRIAARG
jgi:hypothetical protein